MQVDFFIKQLNVKNFIESKMIMAKLLKNCFGQTCSLKHCLHPALEVNYLTPLRTSRSQTGKSFWCPDFTNRPDQKSNGLNPGDSANPDTTRKSLLFAPI
jgi:hypothetical protein